MTYVSEYGQDVYLDQEVFKGLTSGTFVEAGAIDGLIDSNTLFFEKERNWRGLLIEPNPSQTYNLVKHRPKAQHSVAALWDKEEFAEFEAIAEHVYVGWAAIPQTMNRKHATDIYDRVPQVNRTRLRVLARPLADVMTDAGMKFANYVSLDLEGAEPKVLSVFPFKDIRVDVFGVDDHEADQTLVELFTQNGYHHLARIGPDTFWRRNLQHGKVR